MSLESFCNPEGIYLSLLSVVSIAIYLGFVIAGRGAMRASLYISLSAPGLLFLCGLFPHEGFLLAMLLFLPTLALFADPGLVVFPIVLAFHLRRLVLGRDRRLDISAIWWGAILLGLYWWPYVFTQLSWAMFGFG